jgi:hypothetical protein
MSRDKKRLEAVARILYMGLPGVEGAAFGYVLGEAADRLKGYALDDTAGDARAAMALRKVAFDVHAWRDKLIAALCDGPPIECACCKRPIPNCARCSEAM